MINVSVLLIKVNANCLRTIANHWNWEAVFSILNECECFLAFLAALSCSEKAFMCFSFSCCLASVENLHKAILFFAWRSKDTSFLFDYNDIRSNGFSVGNYLKFLFRYLLLLISCWSTKNLSPFCVWQSFYLGAASNEENYSQDTNFLSEETFQLKQWTQLSLRINLFKTEIKAKNNPKHLKSSLLDY